MALAFTLLVAGHLAGAAAALAAPVAVARALSAACGIAASLGALGLALGMLLHDAPFALEAPRLLAIDGGMALALDPLGAFFVLLAGGIGVPAALYAAGVHPARGRPGRIPAALLHAFLLSMTLVPLADNVLTFLACWELMSLASYALVLAQSDDAATVSAGRWYLVMTQVGLLCLLPAFLLLAGGGTAFADLRAAGPGLSPAWRGAVFVLAVAGFGSKAGLIPLHVWLPRAHPAAPSHVSALMSGVMVKMGVYGLCRVAFDLLGGGPAWWGALVLALGGLSALTGVLYALSEDDLKRLLAYSTVENVGLIAVGLGAGLLFHAHGAQAAAVLALTAALCHALNHAVFKALLFMGAGAVLHATGTRDMNRHGGLIKRLPWTAACFLVGALAISGLPPLNGFVSEWLLLQSLLPGIGAASPVVAVVMVLAVGAVALTAGLAAAAFVKAFGITFLALPRSAEAATAQEAGWPARLAMAGLAATCAALGLLAIPVLSAITPVAADLVGPAPPRPALRLWLAVPMAAGVARMSPAVLAGGLAVVTAGAWLAVRLAASRRPVRVTDTWGCGRVTQTARMEYTATSFAEPLRRIFAAVYRPTEDVTRDVHPGSRYFVQAIEYRARILPWLERYGYEPVVAGVRALGAAAGRVQSGSIHAYLAYLVGALVALLLLALAWPGA